MPKYIDRQIRFLVVWTLDLRDLAALTLHAQPRHGDARSLDLIELGLAVA
ncbi:MAG: hypothetical protein OXL38_18220 [Gammaproteobacteria bacterium]|nr:hypothetical protein [Gammaproteobacteria bacterium]